jgi:hypothetical protein
LLRDDDVLSCRRHAPALTDLKASDDDKTAWGWFPAVIPGGWCGEWAAGGGRPMADLDPGVVLSPSTMAATERLTVTVQGRDWPATLGDFTLVGPVNNHGAWRWYERQYNGATHRIKVDHQLMPLFPPHPQ